MKVVYSVAEMVAETVAEMVANWVWLKDVLMAVQMASAWVVLKVDKSVV